MNVFPEKSYRVEKGKENQIFYLAAFSHWMFADNFVRKIGCPYAVLNGFRIDTGKHPERDVYDVVRF